MRCVSDSSIIVVPRALRIKRLVRLRIPWRLPAWEAITLPVAEKRNRFLQPDLVLSFGILSSYFKKLYKKATKGNALQDY